MSWSHLFVVCVVVGSGQEEMSELEDGCAETGHRDFVVHILFFGAKKLVIGEAKLIATRSSIVLCEVFHLANLFKTQE